MKEEEVYVKADEDTTFQLREFRLSTGWKNLEFVKPTTGILLTKEELVKLVKYFYEEAQADMKNFDELLKEKGLL